MQRTVLSAIMATTLMLPATLPAFAQDAPTVKSVEVNVDMTAVQSPEAGAYWGKIDEDLQGAILARLTDQMDEEKGARIEIDIDEVALASGFAAATGLVDTKLVGVVKEMHDVDNSRFQTYDLSVDMTAARPLLGAEFDPAAADADKTKAYQAMIDVFADHVVTNLK